MLYKLNKDTEVFIAKIKNLTPNQNGVYENLTLKKYKTNKELIFRRNDILSPEKFLEKSKKFPGQLRYINEKKNIDILSNDSYIVFKLDDYLIFSIDTNLKLEDNKSYKKNGKKIQAEVVDNQFEFNF